MVGVLNVVSYSMLAVVVLLMLGFGAVMLVSVVAIVIGTNTNTTNTTPTKPKAEPTKPKAEPPNPKPEPTNPKPNKWSTATLTCYEETKHFASAGTDPTSQNVVAVLEKDFPAYKNKALLLELPTGVHRMEVRDSCAASAPSCMTNATKFGNNFLIDINHLALKRVWPSKPCMQTLQTVKWAVA